MALDKKMYEAHEVVGKIRHLVANGTLTARDHCVRVTADAVSGPFTVTLANPSECRGLWVGIVARDADLVNTVTVTDANDSENWLADAVMNNPGESLTLFSDGYMWHKCCDHYSIPSMSPSGTPSTSPSESTSSSPSASPSGTPSTSPSTSPSGTPSTSPSASESSSPSASPSGTPSTSPSASESSSPSASASGSPSTSPSASPSSSPSE